MKLFRKNQRGMVSITVTVVLMLVVSITVLSFGAIVRRNQREALDNQLSSQAFYAAESGINDVKAYIAQNYPSTTPPNKTACGNDSNYTLPGTVDAANGVSYTCTLISSAPNQLKYTLSPSADSKVFPVQSANGTIQSITFSWTPSTDSDKTLSAGNCPAANAVLPTASNWNCPYGMIRLDIVPIAGTLSRAGLMGSQFTVFATPLYNSNSSATSLSYAASAANIYGGTANQGARPSVNCTDGQCQLTVTMPTSGANASTLFYVRASVLYEDTTLSVSANADTANIPLQNAQLMIDSTGKAQDVLRRIQVRVPLTGDTAHADYGVESAEGICKDFTTIPSNDTSGDSSSGSNVLSC